MHWQTLLLLPSFARLLSDHISAARVRDHLELPAHFDLGLLVQALTPTRANVGYDYERLEILGDAFLKVRVLPFMSGYRVKRF